ncbi:MAG: hypothetical protein ACXVBG_22045, partial [Isosphaeraceae bacterium]
MSRIVSFSGRRCAVRIARGLGRCRDLRLVGVVMTFGVVMILGGFMSLGVFMILGGFMSLGVFMILGGFMSLGVF